MTLTALEKKVIDLYQKSFPLCQRPYQAIANQIGTSEAEVLGALKSLKEKDVLSRVGPVFSPNRVGQSCLAALKIPPDRLEEIAEQVSALESVNHNYEREHAFNLWFVLTAPNQQSLDQEVKKIEQISGENVLVLPLEREFFIDLGFEIPWEATLG